MPHLTDLPRYGPRPRGRMSNVSYLASCSNCSTLLGNQLGALHKCWCRSRYSALPIHLKHFSEAQAEAKAESFPAAPEGAFNLRHCLPSYLIEMLHLLLKTFSTENVLRIGWSLGPIELPKFGFNLFHVILAWLSLYWLTKRVHD